MFKLLINNARASVNQLRQCGQALRFLQSWGRRTCTVYYSGFPLLSTNICCVVLQLSAIDHFDNRAVNYSPQSTTLLIKPLITIRNRSLELLIPNPRLIASFGQVPILISTLKLPNLNQEILSQCRFEPAVSLTTCQHAYYCATKHAFF